MMLDPISELTARPVRSVLQILQEGVQTLFHLLLFSLLVLGFGGLLYKALRAGGWVESVLGRIWDQHPTVAIVTLLAALAGATWGTRLFDRLPMFGKRGDMLVYGCLALGLFFAFKLVVTGSL
jgi:Na+/H+ antiporter NhaC